MVPATAPLKQPGPTKAAKEGSCPEPPPETTDTCGSAASGLRYTTLFSLSRATLGLVSVMECSAEATSWLGSLRKCLAAKESVSEPDLSLLRFLYVHDIAQLFVVKRLEQ